MTALPTGRRGQALAVALTLLTLAVLYLGVLAPAVDWYRERAERLTEQQTLAARMAGIVATAPALQRRLEQAGTATPQTAALFEGATDAVAGAALQQAVQDMAARSGATVTSAEVLPAEPAGSYRRLGLHVTTSGGWPVIVALLGALAEATPRMLVDDVSLRQSLALGQPESHPLEAGFTVIAFAATQPGP